MYLSRYVQLFTLFNIIYIRKWLFLCPVSSVDIQYKILIINKRFLGFKSSKSCRYCVCFIFILFFRSYLIRTWIHEFLISSLKKSKYQKIYQFFLEFVGIQPKSGSEATYIQIGKYINLRVFLIFLGIVFSNSQLWWNLPLCKWNRTSVKIQWPLYLTTHFHLNASTR